MYTIGEFASIGRVSVRMLRHYDAIGLLTPASVDPFTGYRHYDGSQFASLARIVAFKDLGFTLEQVRAIVDGSLADGELRALLERRRAELERELHADRERLRRIEARLRLLQGDETMNAITVELKSIPALHVAEASAHSPGFGPENNGPVVGPLFARLEGALERAGVASAGAGIALYEASDAGEGEGAVVRAAIPVAASAEAGDAAADAVTVTDLPALPLAATLVHHGTMAGIGESWEALFEWISANGLRPTGPCREVYLVAENPSQEDWVTELQYPVERVG